MMVTAQLHPQLKPVLIASLLVVLWAQHDGVVVVNAADSSQDMYCGSSWMDAFQNCHEPCSSGDDSECKQEGWSCYGYTGCASKSFGTSGDDSNLTNIPAEESFTGEDEFDHVDITDATTNNYCGTNWVNAMLTCSIPCPRGAIDCQNGQECFAATNCDVDLEPLKSEMILSLLGAQGIMNGNETGVLEESILSFLETALEENQIGVKGAGVTDQNAFSGRKARARSLKGPYGIEKNGIEKTLPHSYNLEHRNQRSKHEVQIELKYKRTSYESRTFSDDLREKFWRSKRRYLPTSSSALDVSMVITGEYRPPPYVDMDMINEDSINRASANVVGDLRERGQRAGSTYFERVDDLRAISKGTATARPTPMPTQSPTLEPSDRPTPAPSSSPTRGVEQSVQTGFGSTLYLGTSRSYGIVFEIKTTVEAPTVSIEGFDIYTSSTAKVAYEIWTKEGTWQGFEGKLEEFAKISEGEVESAGECTEESLKSNYGECRFTSIPLDSFEAVPIFGGGASRSFYFTLKSKEIIYSLGISSEGSSVMGLVNQNSELEIYEGAGVLMYPFDQATDLMLHYRKPRGFLGVVHYNRNPCANEDIDEDGMYTWPCDTRSPVSSFQISSDEPTMDPTSRHTSEPSGAPTLVPTIVNKSVADVDFEEKEFEAYDEVDVFGSGNVYSSNTVVSSDDIIVDSNGTTTIGNYSDYKTNELLTSNIVLTLRRVPNEIMNEREILKYQEVLLEFLRSQDSLTEVKMDVVSVIVWHQSLLGEEKETPKSNTIGKVKIPSTASSFRDKIRTKTRKMAESVNEFTYTSPSHMDPTKVDVEVTTIIQSTKSTLPPSTASKFLLFVVESMNSTLMDELHAEKTFYSYFKDINGISGRLIDQVTKSPTMSPTKHAYTPSANKDDNFSNEKASQSTLSVFLVAALIIGTLWCFLTIVTVCYLSRARSEMANNKFLTVSKTVQTSRKVDVECGNEQGSHTSMGCITLDGTVDWSSRNPDKSRLALTSSRQDANILHTIDCNPDIVKSTRYSSSR